MTRLNLDNQIEILSALARMAGGAAHEINNPLAVISGRAQLMEEKAPTEEERRVWQLISDQSDRISGVISTLMEFASPRPAQPKACEIGIIVQNALNYFSSPNLLNLKAVKFDKDIENNLPDVWVDEAQVTKAIKELLQNAVTVAGHEPYISIVVRLAADGQYVQLSVRDNGPGMDARALAGAFTPFYSTQTGGRRRGLGLSVAWRYVVNNQGQIWIESQNGQGTTVHMLLPQARP